MDWDRIRIFHAVAEAGSFTHAGQVLNLSQSAVSRQISALENSLNVTLFHRHARGLILTEQGELLFRTARDVFSRLAMTEAQLTESKDKPKGSLRVTTTVALGTVWLTPRMREFLDIYPDVSVELLLDDRELDLGMREADVAIRMMPPRQRELVQRHLMTVRVFIYGSKSYIERHGCPRTIDDLDNHRLIAVGEDPRAPAPTSLWLLKVGARRERPRRAVLSVNNMFAVMRAAQAGVGLAALPSYLVQGEGDLVQVLPDVEGPRVDAYFVYSEELRDSKRIQVFRDFLLRKVAESSF
jgi:DNA-binding transcriptional LysR family regulator